MHVQYSIFHSRSVREKFAEEFNSQLGVELL